MTAKERGRKEFGKMDNYKDGLKAMRNKLKMQPYYTKMEA